MSDAPTTADVGGIAGERVRCVIGRIERVEAEEKGIQDDIKDIFAEAKGTGFDTKVMRQIIRLRKMEKNDRQELDALLELYMAALGME